MKSPKRTNPTDKHVGNRLRMRRIMLAISQEKLGGALGLTFQQIQKYEKGTNRISASKLHKCAGVLQVPVSFFFEGLPSAGQEIQPTVADYVSAFLADKDGLNLIKAFTRINAAKLRGRLGDLVEEIADNDAQGAPGTRSK